MKGEYDIWRTMIEEVYQQDVPNAAQVHKLVVESLALCPICKYDTGFDVEGTYNDYIKCRNCQAMWHSTDLTSLELKNLQLTTSPQRGKFAHQFVKLKYKMKPIDFWKSFHPNEQRESPSNPPSEKKQPYILTQVSEETLLSEVEARYLDIQEEAESSDDSQTQLLLALIKQNDVIIRQNELIRRIMDSLLTSIEKIMIGGS